MLDAKLARIVKEFLASQVANISAQIAASAGLGKAAKPPKSKADEIADEIDFDEWKKLPALVAPALLEAALIGGEQAIASLSVIVGDEAINAIDTYELAQAWANNRSAEMVGMRWVDGELVQNPNAAWQITEGTRDMIRVTARDAVTEGWSSQQLADHIAESHGFSEARADMIARTEIRMAQMGGQMEVGRALGATHKQWTTASDDIVSPECVENGEAGPDGDGIIPIDEDYPSGESAPPQHPNCRCVVSVLIRD